MPPVLTAARPTERGAALELRFAKTPYAVRLPLKALRHSAKLGADTSDPPRASIVGAAVTHGGEILRVQHRDRFEQILSATFLSEMAGLVPLSPAEQTADLIVDNASWLITCAGSTWTAGDPRAKAEAEMELIEDGALAVRAGRVLFAGSRSDLMARIRTTANTFRVDARGGGITPGLVDPHTHPVFAGQRAREFAMRAEGKTYLEIAEAGGGIRSTMAKTRAASDEELKQGTRRRLARLLGWGVTTIEGKSGYSLDTEGELRMLRILKELDPVQPIDISRTLLAAHVVPPEYKNDRDAYVNKVIEEIIPACGPAEQGLADSCDVFCEEGAFTLAESRRILEAAKAEGLGLKIHAEQFTDIGATMMAVELGALSADHLEAATAETIDAMANSETVAVLLPGAALTVGDRFPDARRLLDNNVPVALGTDLNPGSSMTESLPLMMSLGTTKMGMTVPEAWLSVTANAARACGRNDVGRLASGNLADFVIHNAPDPFYIPYHLAHNTVSRVFKWGRPAR